MAARDHPQFAKDAFAGTVHAIVAYQDHTFELLADALSSMPMDYRKIHFAHIILSTLFQFMLSVLGSRRSFDISD